MVERGRYELVPCTCGREARVVICGVGSYVNCPWCKRATCMQTTREDALRLWDGTHELYVEEESKDDKI